jgi:tRNA A37 methylthiotransferase MiaB
MMNPATLLPVLDDMVEAFAPDTIFKFIHVPVQSGSDRVLRSMGREYSCADFEQIAAAFRKRYPSLTLATDMIVGFPGETDGDFSASLDLLGRIRANKVNVTRFSRRPFTPLTDTKGLPDAVKKDRSRVMNLRAEEICHTINAPLIGQTVPFIVTEKVRQGSVMARTPSYLGVVLGGDLPVGYRGQARLEKEHRYYFSGSRVAGAPLKIPGKAPRA